LNPILSLSRYLKEDRAIPRAGEGWFYLIADC
jgi:hypothetical protein